MASLPTIIAWLAGCTVPSALWLRYIWRIPPQRDPALAVWGTFLFGLCLAIPVVILERFLARVSGLQESLGTLGAPAALLFVMLIGAPLQEAAKLAAAWPAFRSSHFDEDFDGLLYATASACGFAAAETALVLATSRPSGVSVARAVIILCAQPLVASLWGHALGRVRRTRVPNMRFIVAWLGAVVVHGLLEHLTASRSVLSLVAAIPLLIALAVGTRWIARDLLTRFGRPLRSHARSMLPSLPPPSLRAMRHALHRSHSPVLFHWILLGALTTTGVMLAMLALAVWVGHGAGLDFSHIERDDASTAAVVPLVLLVGAVLSAFPVSGYLLAKASGSDGVLEPALSAALAIVALMVMLGVAAPVALVFALAFATIAFGLACAGAWFGLGR